MTIMMMGRMGSHGTCIAAAMPPELSPRATRYFTVPPTSVQICHSHMVSQSYGQYQNAMQLSQQSELAGKLTSATFIIPV